MINLAYKSSIDGKVVLLQKCSSLKLVTNNPMEKLKKVSVIGIKSYVIIK